MVPRRSVKLKAAVRRLCLFIKMLFWRTSITTGKFRRPYKDLGLPWGCGSWQTLKVALARAFLTSRGRLGLFQGRCVPNAQLAIGAGGDEGSAVGRKHSRPGMRTMGFEGDDLLM